MERVKKGEEYWLIDYEGSVVANKDERWLEDNINFECGNYFTTREEAEAMLRKLRAVLKGVDVIEMPDVNEVINRLPYAAGYEQDIQLTGYRHGYCNCYDWLKSKIIK